MNRLTKLDKDITKVKGTYMPYNERPIVTLSSATYVQCLLNKLGRLEDLEEEIGCPLDVYIKLITKKVMTIYDNSGEMCMVSNIDGNIINIFKKFKGNYTLKVNRYKEDWFLREDKSE